MKKATIEILLVGISIFMLAYMIARPRPRASWEDFLKSHNCEILSTEDVESLHNVLVVQPNQTAWRCGDKIYIR